MRRVAQIAAGIARVEREVATRYLGGGVITDAAAQREFRENLLDASQGRNAVFYSDGGHPNIMVRVPAYRLDDLGMGFTNIVHPGFVFGGVAAPEVWVGKYHMLRDGTGAAARVATLPGVDATTSINWDDSYTAIGQNGDGWHMLSNATWAAIALLSQAYGHVEYGNDNWGRAYNDHDQQGIRWDGDVPGDSSGSIGRTLTGSGPLKWRHDGSPAGIADLVGNVWDWTSGVRINAGEINILANPITGDHGAASADWQAILQDGSLVAPGTADTLKYDATSGISLDTVITTVGSTSTMFHQVAAEAGVTVPDLLKQLALFPGPDVPTRGRLYANNDGERFPRRGGNWNNSSNAGRFALNLSNARSHTHAAFGSRAALVL